MVGGIMTQIGAATTDAEKAKLQQDLADAQRIIQENADATATAAQKAQREHSRSLTEAQKKAADGEKAVAHATSLGIKYAIEHFKDKDGKTVYEWEDTDTVFELLDKASVKYDLDKGEAAGLDKALEALAKSKPFLLKNKGNPQPAAPAGTWPQQPGAWPQAIGTPPSAPNTGTSPAGRTVDDYAAMPAYRAAFGRLKGMPGAIPVPQPAVNPQQ